MATKKVWIPAIIALVLGLAAGVLIGLSLNGKPEQEAPVIRSFYLTDLQGNPLREDANWQQLPADVLIHVEYQPGTLDDLWVFSAPTGTEAWSMAVPAATYGSSDAQHSEGHMQHPWKVPEGFLGHLSGVAYHGDTLTHLDTISVIRADTTP